MTKFYVDVTFTLENNKKRHQPLSTERNTKEEALKEFERLTKIYNKWFCKGKANVTFSEVTTVRTELMKEKYDIRPTAIIRSEKVERLTESETHNFKKILN